MLDAETIARILAQYPNLRAIDRAHLAKRLAWCQYDEIAAFLPAAGRVLDIGCGHGHFCLYLVLTRPGVTAWGCDPDERKVGAALSAAARREDERVRFHHGAAQGWEAAAARAFDGIVLLDILYLMPPALQEETLQWALERLAPGGAIVIKTIDPDHGLRSRLAELQEFIMVRLLRKTRSSGAFAGGMPLAWYRERFEQRGLRVRVAPLPANRTPSALIVGERRRP